MNHKRKKPKSSRAGYLMRNALQDPIGGSTPDGIMVYDWSLADLRKRLTADSSVSRP